MDRHSAAAYIQHRRKIAKRRGFMVPERDRSRAVPVDDRARYRRANLRYGIDLEDRAVEAFASGAIPAWFLGVRPATEAEDHAGIDLWAETSYGPIAVQVKSSAARAQNFRDMHPDMEVAVVVLHMEMADERIRDRVIGAVARVVWARQVREAA